MLGMSLTVIRLRGRLFERLSISSTPLSSAAGIASQKWRNAFFSKPMSTNIAFKPIYVFDSALVDTAYDVPRALTFDTVFLEAATLEQSHTGLEFLHA